MRKRLFANLGFLLQIAGLLTVLPIVVGLYFKESEAVISLFIACVTFLGCGFLLNALCERKDLDFKGSNFLFLATFIVLPLIGSFPYLYLDLFSSPNFFDRFTNGIFESVSGFTTTGFSFVANPDVLPKSLLVYRSLTELIGGIGIVFLLLAFFQSRKSLNNLSNSLGMDDVCGSVKKTYFSVFAVYGALILIFTGIFYLLGFTNVLSVGTFVIDTITGGFQPIAGNYTQYLDLAPKICIILLMLFGSLNFAFSYNLFARKFRKMISSEAILFLVIMIAGTIVISAASQIGVLDSFFHVVSMASSTGQSYIPLSSFGNTSYSVLIVLMLIGGCAFSMAGGIRVSRIISFGKSSIEAVTGVLVKEKVIPTAKSNVDANEGNGVLENLSVSVSILLFIIVLAVFAVIFTTIGVSFTDAVFEVGSALTTNGISMGVTNVLMPVGYKWLMIAAMTIGRVEILTILIALFSIRIKSQVFPNFSLSLKGSRKQKRSIREDELNQ